MDQFKFCGGCSTSKPTSEFYKNATKRDGLCTQCKACSNTRTKSWAAANPEKRKAIHDAWRNENRWKEHLSSENWRKANMNKVRAAAAERWKSGTRRDYQRSWRMANREKYTANNIRQYKTRDKEKQKSLTRAWRSANKERIAERQRKYFAGLPDAYVARKLTRDVPALKRADIPQSLIELKRAQLLIARKLKEKK